MFQENQILAGRYQVLQEIGKGGAGIVYLAYDLSLQKYVVVKRLKGTLSTSSIRNEVDILKRLHHSNLPQVYDFLELNDGIFTVIDYVEGTGLEKVMAGQLVVSQEDVLHWFRQLTDVLVYLHSQNPAIIHGDIKPENIIITPDNNAVLIDFNVSLSENPEKILGFSYDYASPEQLSFAQMNVQHIPHEPLDGRSDIYSLAATFYQLISGRQPSCFYPNEPTLSLGLPWPESFCRIIDRCMRKEREERYADAEQLARAVRRMRRQELHYGLYLACQAACLLLSGFLLAGGIFCVITGVRTRTREAYVSDYNTVCALMNEKRYEEAREAGLELLNDGSYQSLLTENNEDKAELLHLLGEVAYQQGSYRQAISYYQQAADALTETSDLLITYYQEAALAYAESGQPLEAEKLLAAAKERGLRGDGLTLLQIQVDALCGKQEDAAAEAEGFLQSCSSSRLCQMACLAVAVGAETPAQQIEWLSRGLVYGDNAELLRRLGNAYAAQVDSLTVESDKKYALEQAEACYRQLAEERYPTRNDVVNLAVILRMEGEYGQSLEILKELEKEYPQDGIVRMQLAFGYEAQGDAVNAGAYTRQAAAVLTEAEVSADDWRQLEALLLKYGG